MKAEEEKRGKGEELLGNVCLLRGSVQEIWTL